MNLTNGERQVAVRDFHTKFGHVTHDVPTVPEKELAELKARLILEEALEVCTALGVFVHHSLPEDPGQCPTLNYAKLAYKQLSEVDLPKVVDELRDLEYVIYSAELAFGLHDASDETFIEVQRANMVKGSEKDGMGKTLKPADWEPPRIADILRRRFPKQAMLFR